MMGFVMALVCREAAPDVNRLPPVRGFAGLALMEFLVEAVHTWVTPSLSESG